MPTDQQHLQAIKETIIDGDEDAAPPAVQAALDDGVKALTILNEALMPGADEVGGLFETGDYFLPELMLTGRALQAAMNVLTPALQAQQPGEDTAVQDTGTVVIATIQTDIHDLGKNMVSSMLTANGFTVFDLGVDVPIKTHHRQSQEENAQIIGVSGLLTTSLPYIQRPDRDAGGHGRARALQGDGRRRTGHARLGRRHWRRRHRPQPHGRRPSGQTN